MGKFSTECPGCGKRLRVAEEHARKKVKCPECGVTFRVASKENTSAPKAPPVPRESSDPTEETTSAVPPPSGSWRTPALVVLSVLIACAVAGAVGYFVYRSAGVGQAKESAARLVKSGRNAIDRGGYDEAERLLREAVQKLERNELFSASTYTEATTLLTHLKKDEVMYEGRWVSTEEREMRSRGYVKHEGRWVTPEAKAKLSQGYIEYKGQWISPDEKRKLDQGLVKYEDRWVTPEEKQKLARGMVRFGDKWVTKEAKRRLQKAMFVPIKGPIGVDTVKVVKLGLEAAADVGAGTLVLELDTPGGSVAAAREIGSLLDEKVGPAENVVQAIAYLPGGDFGGAWSAGAFLAFSCDRIYARPGTAMGAAQQVVQLGGSSVPVKYFAGGAKMDSAWIGSFRAQAEKNGHPPAVAEAMAREDCELWVTAVEGDRSEFDLRYSKGSESRGGGLFGGTGGFTSADTGSSSAGGAGTDLIKKQGQILSLTAGQIGEFGIGKIVPEGQNLQEMLDVEKISLSQTSVGPELDRITREWQRIREALKTKLAGFVRHIQALDANLQSAVLEGTYRRFSHRMKRSSHHLNRATALSQDLLWLGVEHPDLGLNIDALARTHFLLRRLQSDLGGAGRASSLPIAVRLDEYVAGATELDFSGDGQLLASVDRRGSISFWHVDSKYRLATYRGSASGSTSVAVDPDGELFAYTNGSKIVLSEVRTGRETQTFRGHRSFFTTVEISPNGELLAGGNLGGSVTLWPLGGSGDVRTIDAHESGLAAVAFSRNGSRLATGARDGAVKVWNTKTGELLHTLKGHSRPITAVSFRPGDEMLASASTKGTIILWDTGSGSPLRKITELGEAVLTLEFSPDGKFLASGGRDKRVRLWNPDTGKVAQLLATCNSAVRCVTFTGSGEHLAGSSTSGRIRVWNAEKSEETEEAEKTIVSLSPARLTKTEKQVQEKIRDTEVVIDLTDTSLREAVTWLKQICPVELQYDSLGVPGGITVSVQGSVTIEEALDAITEDERVDWKIEGEKIVIGSASKLGT